MAGPGSARQKKFFQSHSGLSHDPVRSAPTPFAIECSNLVLRQAQDERNLNNFRGQDYRHGRTRLSKAKKFFQSQSGLSQDPVRPELVEGSSKVFEPQSALAQNSVRSAPTPFVLSLSKDPVTFLNLNQVSPKSTVRSAPTPFVLSLSKDPVKFLNLNQVSPKTPFGRRQHRSS